MFNNAVVGMEIGKRTIKFVSGSFSMGKFVLKKHFVIDTPDNAFLANGALDSEVAGPYIREIFKANKLNKSNVHVAVNTDKSVLRERILPKAQLQDLRRMAKFEIEQFLPYGVEDFVVDYKILSIDSEDGDDVLNALVAAVPRDIIESYMATSKKCGFTIRSINIYSDCLGKFVENYLPYPDENILVVDVGASLARLIIFKNNEYFASFNSNLGGDEATKLLARDQRLGIKEAEQTKVSMGRAMSKDIYSKNSLNEYISYESVLTTDYCDSLGSEISRVINYFRTRKISGIIHRVVLIGGGSKIKEMDKYLQGMLGVDVEYFDKLQKMNFSASESKTIHEDIGKIAPAIGAVLRRAGNE